MRKSTKLRASDPKAPVKKAKGKDKKPPKKAKKEGKY